MAMFQDPYETFFLDYLFTKLENGSSTKRALILYSEQLPRVTSFQKRITLAIKDMEKGQVSFESILLKYNFVNNFQYNLIVNSSSTVTGLKLIRSFQQGNSNLVMKMINPIMVPLLVIIATFGLLIWYLGVLAVDIVALRKLNPEVEFFLGIPSYFNYAFAYSGLIIFSFMLVFIFASYMYMEKYKPAWIYKILETQSYADSRFMFRILNEMLSSGISFYKASTVLSKDYFKTGLRPFFADLSVAIKKNKKSFTVFDKYNFPAIIVADIKLSELSKTSLSIVTKGLAELSDTMYEKNIGHIVIQWKLIFWLACLLVSVIIGSDIMNIVISTFTFKTLYQ